MIVPNEAQRPADVASHYDELDAVYREIWGEHVHHGLWRTGRESVAEATDALSDLVAAKLRVRAGQHLVDIGCGYGATAARLVRREGARVTGFTLSQEQARVARGREQPRPDALTFHVRDWLENGAADGAYDGGYAIESTEHMADKAGLFREAARTLQPGGRLVVCAWLAADAPTAWEVRHLLKPICREGRLPGMGTRADYEGWAADAGFALVDYADVTREVRRTWAIVTRRIMAKMATTRRYRALVRRAHNRSFARSLPRLMLAYRTGAMRYGLFVFERRQAVT